MEHKKLTLSVLEGCFSICRLEKDSEIPSWVNESSFLSIIRTPEELSVVCQESSVPAYIRAERNWRCLKVEGPLDFGLTGIIAGLSKILADCGIGVFVLSTYDTDYILVREKNLESASKALFDAGHTVLE